MFMLLICMISLVDTLSINNVQGRNYTGGNFVNIKHDFLAVCRKVILSKSTAEAIRFLCCSGPVHCNCMYSLVCMSVHL